MIKYNLKKSTVITRDRREYLMSMTSITLAQVDDIAMRISKATFR
jgi:hypothetical protein